MITTVYKALNLPNRKYIIDLEEESLFDEIVLKRMEEKLGQKDSDCFLHPTRIDGKIKSLCIHI